MTQQTKTKRCDLRIQVTDVIAAELKEDFKISQNHVANCLKFFTNSKLAKNVRKAAIQKMEKVMKDNANLMNEFE